ncbi:diguanylate cyclase [Paenibacillus sp. PsM32]|uniref:GGDEF domain-containing protein n=1 Tax=Paenibacillus sp. PsM32 TaxID=3030536 RepID=UPI00263B146B|nr:diguanylate cyclase [Paenibacillus sp. PsM32]MDN4618997.1 diguanylate cyclase [Paenibacillus sp. PsM32]
MLTIIQSLLNNLTFLTTTLFFGNLILKWLSKRINIQSLYIKLLSGVIAGIIGILLTKYFSFRLSPMIVLDLRQVAIILSFYFGGALSSLITAVIIGVYRLFLIDPINFSSFIGFFNAIFTFVITGLFMRKGKELALSYWLRMMIGILCVYALSVISVLGEHSFFPIIVFAAFYIPGVLFVYYLLRYMKRTDDALLLMREAANLDFLTGLHNPRAFEKMFEQKTINLMHYPQPFGLLLLDIDHFKHVNDTYGHLNGDTVLIQIAQLLKEAMRSNDHCARKGGEEFAAILNDCGIEKTLKIAESIRKKIEAHDFQLEDGQMIHITISIGVSCYPQDQPENMFEQADQALYIAKSAGRNQVQLAKPLS